MGVEALTIQELKKELAHLTQAQLVQLCLRLARHKLENKELLTYLLFNAHDEQAFVNEAKSEMEKMFADIPAGNSPYLVKKSFRKILRVTGKWVRYTASKPVELELLLHYCRLLLHSGQPVKNSPALAKLYALQIKKCERIISGLHEDLQYDYSQRLKNLSLY